MHTRGFVKKRRFTEVIRNALKTLTSLNKEVRPFFLGDKIAFGVFSSSLSDEHLEVLKAILALRS